jgi:hypothetical protein
VSAGDGDWEPTPAFLIDNLALAGAGSEEVLAALRADPATADLGVVFVADRTTMRAYHHGLLAVTTLTREDCDGDDDYETEVQFGREFRTIPAAVIEIHGNLFLANMDFSDFSQAAHNDPEGVFRRW